MSRPSLPLRKVEALICEDEPLAVRALRTYLEDVDWVEVIGEARDGGEAVRLIHKLEPDLVFLDVRMPEKTGMEVLQALTHHPAVVFTTAHEEYALRAFEEGAVDYLVKPFGPERLLETLARVRIRLVGEGLLGPPEAGGRDDDSAASTTSRGRAAAGASSRPARRLFATDHGAVVPVPVESIVHVGTSDSGAVLVTTRGRYEIDATLTELETRLDPDDFLRIHRSHIVNLAHVVSIRPYDSRRLGVRLADESTLVASRAGSRLLRERMG